MFAYGFLAVLPKIIVSYVVGLGIEFVVAQWKKEEIQEGFLVSGILIPMIVPVDCPLWILAVATAFSVIFASVLYNIKNITMEKTFTQICELFDQFSKDANLQMEKGNKAAGTRKFIRPYCSVGCSGTKGY